MNPWLLRYEGYLPDQEALREALCTVGNGVFATRGALPESNADGVHYPGTYIAGLYDRLGTEIAGREVLNEDLVNVPNWLALRFRAVDGPWFSMADVDIEEHRLELDVRQGVLHRHTTWRDDAGRRTSLTQRRFVSMRDPDLAALETTFVAHGWSGRLTVRSGIDAGVTNAGVARYSDLCGDHLEILGLGGHERIVHADVRTVQSRVRIVEALRTEVFDADGEALDPACEVVVDDGEVAHELTLDLADEEAVTVEKVVALTSSRAHAISEPREEAVREADRAPAFTRLLERHVLAWDHLWGRFHLDLDVSDDVTRILNVHIFHLLVTVSENTIDLDVGVPARGWHGEAYRGHIFWDELFILPLVTFHIPVLTRSLLLYRHRRLDEARWLAAQEGHPGAMFPWQSGSDGREESQTLHLNPRSGEWDPDHSNLQRHIGIAIAYNVWHYVEVTDDLAFLRFHGGELLVEIARFFASLAEYDRADDRYHLRGVMGPDEYHEGYPDRDEPGVDDNAYTNVMTVWVLLRTMELLDRLPERHREELMELLELSRAELQRWEDLTRRMYVPFHDQRPDGSGRVISQFEGYEQLEELDWSAYRDRYGDIQRMDRILKAEGDTPDRYQVSKQADALMLLYLLSEDEVHDLFDRIGYDLDHATVERTIDYYLARTSHGSTLSKVVHSWILSRRDRESSWVFFTEALRSDVEDVQGGTTPEGIHLGAMAGTVDLVQRSYTGLEVRAGVLLFRPALPDEIPRLELELHYRGHRVQVDLDHERITVATSPGPAPPIHVGLDGSEHELGAGERVTFEL